MEWKKKIAGDLVIIADERLEQKDLRSAREMLLQANRYYSDTGDLDKKANVLYKIRVNAGRGRPTSRAMIKNQLENEIGLLVESGNVHQAIQGTNKNWRYLFRKKKIIHRLLLNTTKRSNSIRSTAKHKPAAGRPTR